MKPKIIFKKIKFCPLDIKKQREVARSLLFKLTGKEGGRSQTGRPIVDKTIDVSISHKPDLVCVATIPSPYKIGVDIEHLHAQLNAKLFLGSVITATELPFFTIFCKKNKFSLSAGVAVFWSIKEAFFKCLDYDLRPGQISILDISEKGKTIITYSERIDRLMKKRNLELDSLKMNFDDKYIYSQTIMLRACPLSQFEIFC